MGGVGRQVFRVTCHKGKNVLLYFYNRFSLEHGSFVPLNFSVTGGIGQLYWLQHFANF